MFLLRREHLLIGEREREREREREENYRQLKLPVCPIPPKLLLFKCISLLALKRSISDYVRR
jgi:hypothetical protein